MKFFIDMPLSPDIAEWLSQKGHTAVHAFKQGMGTATDRSIIKRAFKNREIIITADLDFPRILALTDAKSPGLILFRGGNYSYKELLERLDSMFKKIPEKELRTSIVVIEKNRIRKRSLPI